MQNESAQVNELEDVHAAPATPQIPFPALNATQILIMEQQMIDGWLIANLWDSFNFILLIHHM